MVPDKFNMVDMEGIDILFRYGDTIPGLYQKLVESIAQCRYQCLYNWYFDGFLIPPTYVEMTVIDNKVWIGNGVSVDEEDTLGFLAPGLKSVTGVVAHITDALARKADQIMCYINPEQDLHGYGHPWAGGSGKNKLPKFSVPSAPVFGVTFTVDDYGVVTANGTATRDAAIGIALNTSVIYGDYYFNGAYGGSESTYNIYLWDSTEGERPKKWDGTNASGNGYQSLAECKIVQGHVVKLNLRVMAGKTVSNVKFYPMICESTETSPTFEPYENICPITGYTGLNVYRESSYDAEADPIIMVNWQDIAGAVYDGRLDVASGKLVSTDAEIASYNGETLPGVWISSMDEYVEGATPTIGAQVVYRLAEPLTYDLTALQLPTLIQGENYIWHDANGDTSVTYWYNKF